MSIRIIRMEAESRDESEYSNSSRIRRPRYFLKMTLELESDEELRELMKRMRLMEWTCE